MTAINAATSASLFNILNGADSKTRADKALSGAAELLDMSTEELNVAQQNGVTLAQLAKEKGVNRNDLLEALAKGLKENAPSALSTVADFKAMAAEVIDGTAMNDVQNQTSQPNWWDSDDSNTSSNRLAALLSQHGVTAKNLGDYLNKSSTGGSSLFDDGESDQTSEFQSQLQSLVSQYGSKGNSYDSKA